MSRNESSDKNWDLIDPTVGSIEEPPNKMSKRMKNFQESWFQEFLSWRELVVKLEDETKFNCKIRDCFRINRSFSGHGSFGSKISKITFQ